MASRIISPLLKILRDELVQIIARIDTGNSNLRDEELYYTLEVIKRMSEKDAYYTKYQACKYIHKKRATFDNLVAEGKIPQGVKLYQGDSHLFWKIKDLDKYMDGESKKLLK